MADALLTNRELASLIILGLLLAFVLIGRGWPEVRSSVRAVFTSMVSPKIFFPILLYVAWVLAALVPASQLGLWDPDLWKVTILWLLLSGFGLVLNLNDAIQKPRFFRQVFIRAVGLSAIVEFFATLESFPLWLEIPAQALAVLFAGVGEVSGGLFSRELFARPYIPFPYPCSLSGHRMCARCRFSVDRVAVWVAVWGWFACLASGLVKGLGVGGGGSRWRGACTRMGL